MVLLLLIHTACTITITTTLKLTNFGEVVEWYFAGPCSVVVLENLQDVYLPHLEAQGSHRNLSRRKPFEKEIALMQERLESVEDQIGID